MRIEIKPGCDEYDRRYVIVDDDGKIVDDAQGYGYKTREKAHKAMWYKFKDGKSKIDRKKSEIKRFFDKYPGLSKFLNKIYENNFKEIARGEVTEQEIIDEVKMEFGVDIPREYLCGPE